MSVKPENVCRNNIENVVDKMNIANNEGGCTKKDLLKKNSYKLSNQLWEEMINFF